MSEAASPSDVSLGDELPASPLGLVRQWFEEAEAQAWQPNPLAFCLATADAEGRPAARMLLCRGFDPDAGYLVFYTNKESRKGLELAARPRGAAVFHWDRAERQVRLEGPVVESPPEESDAYWATRQHLAQIAAWASEQSRPIASRHLFLERVLEADQRFAKGQVPRPPHWGGYRLFVEHAELWLGAAGRVHDRAAWTRDLERDGDSFRGGPWRSTRLQP